MTDQEPPGFEEYAAARWPALCRTGHLLTGDPAAGEELAQATLVTVFARWAKVAASEKRDAYVRKVMLNLLLTEKRRLGRRAAKAHLVLATAPQPPDPAERLDLWSRLATLPPRQRAVIVLRYYEDLSEAQIAEVLGISPGTVKSQASDALRRLRADLAQPTDSEVSP